MNKRHSSILWAAVLLAAATTAWCQNPECQDVRFSDEVLKRLPGAQEACLDVITRDGQDYAVLRAQLLRVQGNTLSVRVMHPDGTQSAPMRIRADPGRRVLVDGKPVRVSELASNQELTAYVRVDRPMVALAPATGTEPLDVVPMAMVEEETRLAAGPTEPEMPRTAGPLELVALFAAFFLAAGLLLTALRKVAPKLK